MYGAPRELNYGAIIQSLTIRLVERIPTVKYLIKRLQSNPIFRLDCSFLLLDSVSSEASYSCMINVISLFGQMNDDLIWAIFTEGFLVDEHVNYDATHFEVRDASKPAERKEKVPEKRDRKSKEERAI